MLESVHLRAAHHTAAAAEEPVVLKARSQAVHRVVPRQGPPPSAAYWRVPLRISQPDSSATKDNFLLDSAQENNVADNHAMEELVVKGRVDQRSLFVVA